MDSIGLPAALSSLAMAWSPVLDIGLQETAGLAAAALIGYICGQRTRSIEMAKRIAERQRELERASTIAHQLETIAGTLRQDLAGHHGRLAQFRRGLDEAHAASDDPAWKKLCSDTEEMLSPTMHLAEQLSLAYDAIRQQTDALESFTRVRTDPLTGVGNARALEENLETLLGTACHGGDFSVALVSIDHDPIYDTVEETAKERAAFPELGRLIQSCMRDSDFVARYGDDDFVVVLPKTKLAIAGVFLERLRKTVLERLAISVSCGIAEYQKGDDGKSLLGRADSAFYSAKAAGENRQFVHTGTQIREYRDNSSPRATDAALPATVLPPIQPLDTAALSVLATTEAGGQ